MPSDIPMGRAESKGIDRDGLVRTFKGQDKIQVKMNPICFKENSFPNLCAYIHLQHEVKVGYRSTGWAASPVQVQATAF